MTGRCRRPSRVGAGRSPRTSVISGGPGRANLLVRGISAGGSCFGSIGHTGVIELNDRHREILEAIGDRGVTPHELGFRTRLREFEDLKTAGLIVYWPEDAPPPPQVVGNRARSGSWNLTAAGMEARGLPPLRFA